MMLMSTLFISYARADDDGLSESSFVRRLYRDLTAHGFGVWWDRVSMPGRGLTFLQEIRDAIDRADRLILVIGPGVVKSDYVRAEWQYAQQICKVINPVMRLGDYGQISELGNLDTPDFRDDAKYEAALEHLLRHVGELAPVPGRLYNVPAMPAYYLARPDDLAALGGYLLTDINKPTVISSEKQTAIAQGIGGIGKSVIAAAFCQACEVRRAFTDGVIWITAGREPTIRDLLRQVGTVFADSPANYIADAMAKQSAGKLLANRVCLIVLDDVWDRKSAEQFRDVIAETRCRLLVTTRIATLARDLGAHEHKVGLFTPEQALAFLREAVGKEDLDFGRIAGQLGYLPLALKIAGARLRRELTGAEWLEKFDHVSCMTSRDRDEGFNANVNLSIESVFEEEADMVLYHTLGIFPEDVPIPQATVLRLWHRIDPALTDFDTEEILDELADLALIDRRIDKAIILHDLLLSYTREKLDARYVQTQNDLLEAYNPGRTKSWNEVADVYLFEYMRHHVSEARQKAEFCDLLTGSPDWMEAKFIACTGDWSYVADLDLVLRDFADPITDPDRLLILTRLYTAWQVVHARVSMYNDTDLKTLIGLGRNAEALSHARWRTEMKEKFDGLLAIYEALTVRGQTGFALLTEAEATARAIQDDDERAYALSKLAMTLAQAGRFHEARAAARPIQGDETRAHTLRALAAALAQVSRFDEAGAAARVIQDDFDRAGALCDLAAALARAGDERASDIFDEARAVARAVQFDSYRTAALRDLAAALAQAGDERASGVFDEAGAAARTIQDAFLRASDLRDLATALARAGDERASSVFDEAGAAARAIRDDSLCAYALRAIVAALAQASCFDEAGAVARTIQDDSSRAIALRELATAFVQAGDERASGVFDEAAAVARAIRSDSARSIVLRELATALAQAGDERASNIFDEAGAVARAEPSDCLSADALRNLATALAQAGRFDEAIAVARTIQDFFYRAEALRAIAAALAQVGDKRAGGIFDEAGAAARAGPGDYAYADALCSLAAPLAQAGVACVGSILDEAWTVACAIQDGYARALALCALAAARAQAGKESTSRIFDEARAVACAIQDDFSRPDTLRALAAALAQAGRFDEAFKALGQPEADEFLKTIAQWSPAFEKVKPGLSVTILREGVRIVGWVRPDWRKIHELLMQP
jgi:tetratricopeptide (TPR) repeat protein